MKKAKKSGSSTDSKHSGKLHSLISLPNEPWLEKWARLFRFKAVCPAIVQYLNSHEKSIRLIDYGCGQDVLFKKYFDTTYPDLSSRIEYVGLDPLIDAKTHPLKNHISILTSKFESVKLPQKADIIIMLAVLEHVDNASELLLSSLKNLKKGGIILGTTPSPLAKYPLEFFSYQLGIISKREIEEHKRYPTRESILHAIQTIEKENGIRLYHTHRYFELGLNNYFEIQKLS